MELTAAHPEPVTYRYHEEILEALARHGVMPKSTTRPQLMMDYLSDLYRYELRALRDRLLRREIPKPEYSKYVAELRMRYVLVSIPPRLWTK